ncbi:MAG: hypothetical protein FWD18_02595 [Micrococcales bacterium]|nr:hypothetical protein [Micrococcales bacterium]
MTPVALVAPPGVDVAAVALALAALLGVEARDADAVVAEQAGTSVADLLLDVGEAELRQHQERAALALLQAGPGVVALGSGAVEIASVREALRTMAGAVVLLDLPWSESARRIGLGMAGATALGPLRASWRAMYERRHALLDEVSTLTVPVGDQDTDRLAAAVAEALDSTVTLDSTATADGAGKAAAR